MSTIPQPIARLLAPLVAALTRALEWLAYHRPVIVRAGNLTELVEDRHRLWDTIDELDKQGGRVLDIDADLTRAIRTIELLAVKDERDIAKATLGYLADRKRERRSRPTSPS